MQLALTNIGASMLPLHQKKTYVAKVNDFNWCFSSSSLLELLWQVKFSNFYQNKFLVSQRSML